MVNASLIAHPGVPPEDDGPSAAGHATLDDERIAAELRRLLATDPEVEGAELRVSVADGIAALSGSARAYARAAAERIARSTVGVRAVRNLIEVPDPWALSDRDLDDILRGLLADIPSVAAGEVTVATGGRVVILAGVARSPGERRDIARIAAEAEAELPAPVEIRNLVRLRGEGQALAPGPGNSGAAADPRVEPPRAPSPADGGAGLAASRAARRHRKVGLLAEIPACTDAAAVNHRIRAGS
ncbi:MAG: BON domain-containing protein [Chloroflexota bacterium]